MENSPKIIIIGTDKCQNSYGFSHNEDESKNTLHHHQIKMLEEWDMTNKRRKKSRHIKIYTWGKKRHDPPDAELHFDVSGFRTPLKDKKAVRRLTGIDQFIQTSIISHIRFWELLEKIVTCVESEETSKISIFCNYGKHRSVGWAEILRNYIYPEAEIVHYGLENNKPPD